MDHLYQFMELVVSSIIYIFVLQNQKTNWKFSFCPWYCGGITEYLASWIQEVAFGTISWDYSYLKFDFNGRTSLLHCVYWGIAGVIYITWIEPWIKKMDQITNKKWVKIVTTICTIFIIWDVSVSSLAAARQNERVHQIPAKGKIDQFCDQFYPDEYMDRIFTNKRNR